MGLKRSWISRRFNDIDHPVYGFRVILQICTGCRRSSATVTCEEKNCLVSLCTRNQHAKGNVPCLIREGLGTWLCPAHSVAISYSDKILTKAMGNHGYRLRPLLFIVIRDVRGGDSHVSLTGIDEHLDHTFDQHPNFVETFTRFSDASQLT